MAMRFLSKGALFSLILYLAIPAWAQKQTRPSSAYQVNREASEQQHKPKLVTQDEGLAILGAALDSRHHAAFKTDCSHFVHGLYQRAGFPYTYAPSSDLYAGIDEFRRVTNPQPGDLAVWRGHAGIVVNPVQHSFFSLMTSGPGISSYDSPYWKRKGRPRFYRYLKNVPGAVLTTSLHTTSLHPTTLDTTDSDEEAEDTPAASEGISNQTTSSSSSVNTFTFNIPPKPAVVNSIHPKPDQITTAFLQSCIDSEPSLRGRDLLNSAQPVIVFDHFIVKKVHIAGTQDWVDVQIDELVSLTGGKGDFHQRSERQRWPITRRDKTTWELTPPRDVVYLPQHIAVRLLAQQLAQFTEDRPAPATRATENAELARLLDELLQK